MSDSRNKALEIRSAIDALRKDKHDRHDTLTSSEERGFTEQINTLEVQLNAVITEGAEKCEHCRLLPKGMVQYTAVRNRPFPYFEVGCAGKCKNKRATGMTPEEAVSRWNDEIYEKPREDAVPAVEPAQ